MDGVFGTDRRMHRVAVLADGFAWNGNTYASLSKVAFASSCMNFLAFPNGRHDDQVDSVSQFLKWSSLRGPFDTMMIDMGAKVFVGGIQIYPPESASSA